MCGTCERIRAESNFNDEALQPDEKLFLEAQLAAGTLVGWFAGLPETGRRFDQLEAHELALARDHAETAARILARLAAKRSA